MSLLFPRLAAAGQPRPPPLLSRSSLPTWSCRRNLRGCRLSGRWESGRPAAGGEEPCPFLSIRQPGAIRFLPAPPLLWPAPSTVARRRARDFSLFSTPPDRGGPLLPGQREGGETQCLSPLSLPPAPMPVRRKSRTGQPLQLPDPARSPYILLVLQTTVLRRRRDQSAPDSQ